MTADSPKSGRKGRRTRIVLILFILLLLLGMCGIAYVVMSFMRSPERKPVLKNESGVVFEFSAFGGSFGRLSSPDGVAFDGDNRIYVTEVGMGRVTVFDKGGNNGRIFVGTPQVQKPKGIDVGPDGNIYVADEGKLAVVVLTPDGTLVREIPTGGVVPFGVCVEGDRLYITTNDRLVVTSLTGDEVGQWGSWGRGLDNVAVVADAAVGANGMIYLTDLNNYRVVALNPRLKRVWQYGKTALTASQHNKRLLSSPYGITLAGDGFLYLVDGLSGQIDVINRSGKAVSSPLGSPGDRDDQFNGPKGMDWVEGNLFVVADTFHNRIVGVRLTRQPIKAGTAGVQ